MEEVIERRHPIYWFDDGSLILDVATYRFKVHHTLVSRHSRYFSALDAKNVAQGTLNNGSSEATNDGPSGVQITFGSERKILAEDVEALLRHLYHDEPLSKDSTFAHVASLLRVSSPQQLDYPAIHKSAADIFESMFPTDPAAFTHDHSLYDALPLATEFNLRAARKAILYSLVTTTEFDVSDSNADTQNPEAASSLLAAADKTRTLSPADSEICTTLMTRLIENFTPTLFTAPAASHMKCTDAFAGDTWMTLVIQPALENDGVYKPLETLQRIKEIDWEAHGLCPSCVAEKIEEWTQEQRTIWDLIDSWLENK
ncbi:hypothetical protein BDN70DRAFT_870594 [Pholiota conissans]|uniref:BTB domain-containing protein n=1 Tax=Pholiota conissans TaxID=109636 RepID=A0A9P5ZE89_9AGAR|nr:hypothetical protein BDN70DRAFT_870594 [Pholiota conissans]